MKKRLFLLLACLISYGAYSQSKYIESQKSIKIDRDFLMNGYIPKQKITESTDKQPFGSMAEIENFLFELNMQKGTAGELTPQISTWLSQNLASYNNDATIIFIRHPLLLPKLFDNSAEKISEKYKATCEKLNIAKADQAVFEKDYQDLKKTYQDNSKEISEIKSISKPSKTKLTRLASLKTQNEKAVTRMGELRVLIESHQKNIDAYGNELVVTQQKFTEAKNYMVEDTTQVLTTVLSKENYSYSDYILNKKNIMIVMLGNFKNYQLQFTNGKKRYQQEASDLGVLINAVTGIDYSQLAKEGGEGCVPAYDVENPSSLPLNLVLLKRAEIDPPSTVELINPKNEKKILSEIHEKSYVGIKVGLSLANVENKFFSLNPNSELTIQTDSLNSKELKTNLMALIELYPFGRDYDRLKPITAANNIPFYERIGLVGGVKISKDPLETIFSGASLAISKEFNVVAGISFVKIAKDVKELEVGYNKSIEYLRDHVDKEYKPTFYFGFSLSPGQLLKSLGIAK